MMVEPSGHCPYLGLKQNQAIRFASPTPEHRCYATGQAQDIPTIQPDYQANYCLAAGHIHCPLYTGLGLPSTPALVSGPARAEVLAPPSGLAGWFAGLPMRDRAIYLGLLTLLAFILGVYAVAGFDLLRTNGLFNGGPVAPNGPSASAIAATTVPLVPSSTATQAATTPPVTATRTPQATATRTPRPSTTPAPRATSTLQPTASATPAPTSIPIFIPPTATYEPPSPTNTPSELTPVTVTPEPPPSETPVVPVETPLPPPSETPVVPVETPLPPSETPAPPSETPAPTEVSTFEAPTEAPPARTPGPQP